MQKIGIGFENYKEFTDSDMYYVDKTLLIRDVVEQGGKVTLFTRPRRFGKTLAQSMLRTFFEEEYDRDGNVIDKRRYFEGKKIMEADEKILSMMGKYPVIMLSMKSAKQPSFLIAFDKLREEIIHEIRRHAYLWDSERLLKEEREVLRALSRPVPTAKLLDEKELSLEVGRYATSLKTLSEDLKKYHGKKVFILLDEYDVPLENAWYSGFYPQMIAFIRSLFESALKTNDALERAVVTGCLRISKESIFTGLNHLKINSIENKDFAEGFGFTRRETMDFLKAYGLADKEEEVQDWYNGYIFGDTEIYNPWSVTMYIDERKNDHEYLPRPYWANTSSNTIIKEMVFNADDDMKEELDLLVNGGTIEKQIHEDITYEDIHENEDNLWNFLFFTGYMKRISERQDGEKIYATLTIPNREIRSIYDTQIRNWFDGIVKKTDFTSFRAAVLSGNTEEMGNFISELLMKSISVFDSNEAFYHGFFVPLLYGVPRYQVKSNREEGNGRPDVVLYPLRPKDPAILFEIKIRKKYNEMEDGLIEAYRQIRDQKYEDGILEDGYAGVQSYGICFCKKSCIVGKYSG